MLDKSSERSDVNNSHKANGDPTEAEIISDLKKSIRDLRTLISSCNGSAWLKHYSKIFEDFHKPVSLFSMYETNYRCAVRSHFYNFPMTPESLFASTDYHFLMLDIPFATNRWRNYVFASSLNESPISADEQTETSYTEAPRDPLTSHTKRLDEDHVAQKSRAPRRHELRHVDNSEISQGSETEKKKNVDLIELDALPENISSPPPLFNNYSDLWPIQMKLDSLDIDEDITWDLKCTDKFSIFSFIYQYAIGDKATVTPHDLSILYLDFMKQLRDAHLFNILFQRIAYIVAHAAELPHELYLPRITSTLNLDCYIEGVRILDSMTWNLSHPSGEMKPYVWNLMKEANLPDKFFSTILHGYLRSLIDEKRNFIYQSVKLLKENRSEIVNAISHSSLMLKSFSDSSSSITSSQEDPQEASQKETNSSIQADTQKYQEASQSTYSEFGISNNSTINDNKFSPVCEDGDISLCSRMIQAQIEKNIENESFQLQEYEIAKFCEPSLYFEPIFSKNRSLCASENDSVSKEADQEDESQSQPEENDDSSHMSDVKEKTTNEEAQEAGNEDYRTLFFQELLVPLPLILRGVGKGPLNYTFMKHCLEQQGFLIKVEENSIDDSSH